MSNPKLEARQALGSSLEDAFDYFADSLAHHDHGRHCERCAGVLVKRRRLVEALDRWIEEWGNTDADGLDPLAMWEELKTIREAVVL